MKCLLVRVEPVIGSFAHVYDIAAKSHLFLFFYDVLGPRVAKFRLLHYS